MLEEAKKICEYQGIKTHIQVPVICPHCNRRTMILDSVKNKGTCIRCGREKPINELLREEEAEWLDRHKGTDIKMRTNRGDCR